MNSYIISEMIKNSFIVDIKLDFLDIELNDNDIEDIKAKLDTGCCHTSIVIRKLGVNEDIVKELKKSDIDNYDIESELTFGVSDSIEKRNNDKRLYKLGRLDEIKSVSFKHKINLEINGMALDTQLLNVNYDRTNNILIGMDVLSKMDIHIGYSKIAKNTVLIACPLDNINEEYINALDRHFGLKKIFTSKFVRDIIKK